MISRRLLRIKCLKSLYSFYKSDSDSNAIAEKNLFFSINKTYDLYHLLLRLIVDVAESEEMLFEQKLTKLLPTGDDLNPNRKFVDNAVVSQLKNSALINGYLIKTGLGWEEYPELIKKLASNMKERDYYSEYMNSGVSSYKEDVKFVEKFYRYEIEGFDYIYEILEDISVLWIDEVEFVVSAILKTLRGFKESDVNGGNDARDLKLMPLYKDKSDVDFVKTLLLESLLGYRDDMVYIDGFTKNWDVERIAFLDRMLIHMAVVEFKTFSDIPISVTMNEYIDLAKFYSTPQSGQFVNGVLDKIASDLEQKGELKNKVKN